jgi:hypothetical protein
MCDKRLSEIAQVLNSSKQKVLLKPHWNNWGSNSHAFNKSWIPNACRENGSRSLRCYVSDVVEASLKIQKCGAGLPE